MEPFDIKIGCFDGQIFFNSNFFSLKQNLATSSLPPPEKTFATKIYIFKIIRTCHLVDKKNGG